MSDLRIITCKQQTMPYTLFVHSSSEIIRVERQKMDKYWKWNEFRLHVALFKSSDRT